MSGCTRTLQYVLVKCQVGPVVTKPARNHEVPGSNPVSDAGVHRTVNRYCHEVKASANVMVTVRVPINNLLSLRFARSEFPPHSMTHVSFALISKVSFRRFPCSTPPSAHRRPYCIVLSPFTSSQVSFDTSSQVSFDTSSQVCFDVITVSFGV